MIALMWAFAAAFVVLIVAVAVVFARVWRRDARAERSAGTPQNAAAEEEDPSWSEDGDDDLPAALAEVPRRSGEYAERTGEFTRIVAAMGQAGEPA